jgi:glycosyltransferase involved in cell wall biosynthesis
LTDALHGIQAQTWNDFELIAIDDGSTDETPTILRDAARADPRIRVVTQEQCGLTRTLNRGLAESTGEYVARHDADDLSAPERFDRQLAYLREHREAGAVGTFGITIDDRGREVAPFPVRTGPAQVRKALLSLQATPIHGSMMFRRSTVTEIGGYRPGFRQAQDLDLWLRLSERYAIDNIPSVLYRWRLHQRGISTAQRAAQLMYAGIAVVFATERQLRGADSYDLLQAYDGDIERFSAEYTLRALLEAWWGELLFRGLNDPRVARPHLASALRGGHIHARTLGLYALTLFGLSWPGGRTIQTSAVSS